jgi:hypothetical protein
MRGRICTWNFKGWLVCGILTINCTEHCHTYTVHLRPNIIPNVSFHQLTHMHRHIYLHCKKGFRFSLPNRDVTYQTLPGREKLNYSRPGRVW